MMVFRVIKIMVITLVALVVLLAIALWTVDFDFLKSEIETGVKEFTGRDLHIGGRLSLHLLPTPRLQVEEVSFANAQWASEPGMITVGKAYVAVNLRSLFSNDQNFVIRRVELSDVRLLLETDKEQQGNWVFPGLESGDSQPASPDAVAGFSIPVLIESAEINNVQVIYRQPGHKDQVFQLDSMTATGKDGTTTELSGKAHYDELPIEFEAAVSAHQVKANIQVQQARVIAQVDFPAEALDFSVKVNSLAKVGALVAVDQLPDAALSAQGQVVLGKDTILLQKVVAAIDGIKLDLDGSVDNASGAIQLATRIKIDSLQHLNQMVAELPALPALPLALSSTVKIHQSRIDISTYKTTLGDSDAEGSARIDLTQPPRIKARLRSRVLDLAPFLPPEQDTPATTSTAESGTLVATRQSGYVFDETPLPLASLRDLNLTVDASIDRLLLRNVEARQIKLNVDAHNGELQLTNRFAGYLGGNFENAVNLDIKGDLAKLQLATKVRNIRIAALSGEGVPAEQIPVTNVNIDLHSSGATPRALAANLNGDVVVNQGAGKVSNELIQRFSGDILAQLFSLLNPFAKKEEFTNWQCSLFALQFESGLGQITGFLLQSEQLLVVGGGDIDLNDESLNIEFNTKPRTGVGVSADMFVTPFVKLGGTLTNPSVGLNKQGLLLSGGAAFLTGGMSFLYTGLMDRATANADQCAKANAAIKTVLQQTDPGNEIPK